MALIRDRDRGAADYEEQVAYRDAIIEKLVQGQGGYHEGSSKFEKWILMVLASLVVSIAGAAIGMYGKLAALEERITGMQTQVNRVERIVEPRYRGAESNP